MLIIVWLIVGLLTTYSACSNIPTLPSETVTTVSATAIGFTPKPTEKAILDHGNLLKRQAYFSTCGYYSGIPVTCAAGYACATNALNYASCCPLNNIVGCNIFVSCVDYPTFASMGFNPYLFNYNTGICTNMAMPYCFTKIWNYATRYTELGCNTQAGYVLLDPNLDVPNGPANAPPPSSEPTDEEEPETNTSGQIIDGDQNTQISGDNNIINYMGDSDEDGGGDGGESGTQGGGASRLSCWSTYTAVALMLLITGICL